jgi:hypothetical protein
MVILGEIGRYYEGRCKQGDQAYWVRLAGSAVESSKEEPLWDAYAQVDGGREQGML